ncbi:hypothetical protein CAL7102_10260 [Dulcicalothrix desertica PCC 7102]|nr:hypothetical protein CAL7102_10260 [Dulcicalothrix desertica PCC 7102]
MGTSIIFNDYRSKYTMYMLGYACAPPNLGVILMRLLVVDLRVLAFRVLLRNDNLVV